MPARPDAHPPTRESGFALLEVLAAVAIAGFALSAVGGLVAATFAGLRSTADRVTLTAAARTLLDSLPQGDALHPGTTTGTLGSTGWRIDVVPQNVAQPDPEPGSIVRRGWVPATVTVTARSLAGRTLRLDTIALVRQASP